MKLIAWAGLITRGIWTIVMMATIAIVAYSCQAVGSEPREPAPCSREIDYALDPWCEGVPRR